MNYSPENQQSQHNGNADGASGGAKIPRVSAGGLGGLRRPLGLYALGWKQL